MSPRPRPVDDRLAEIGLEIGQIVRFVGRSDRRFREGVVLPRETDGSIGLRDDRGRVEVTAGLPDGAEIVAMAPKGADEGRLARIGTAP